MHVARRRLPKLVALLGVAVLVASACNNTTPGDDDGQQRQGGSFTMQICEPEHLIPTNSNETCGSQVLQTIFDGLINYEPESGDPYNVIATDISTEDDKTFTITLSSDWTFHNGEPVTAQSFVNAWNYGADQRNLQDNSFFFAAIQGYDDLQCQEVELDENDVPIGCLTPPTADAMSGLKAVDDTTLEITLSEPFALFPLTIGYGAFYPLPDAFFDDPEAFEENPIGNGPYKMAEPWKHNQYIKVERYDEYAGTEPGNADSVEFRIYGEDAGNAAYLDVQAGEIDVLDFVPPEQIAAAKEEFGDRYYESASSLIQTIGFPLYVEEFAGPEKADLRKSFSMAIDRAAIGEAIFDGTRVPADSFIAPVVPGYREGACGELCTYNPEKAKEMFDAAGGLPEGFVVELWFNNDGGHEEWFEAIANQLNQNLGVEVKFGPSVTFEQILEHQDNNTLTGPFRFGWVFDYPHMENYLRPMYETGASSNRTRYSNEEFDALLKQGDAAGPEEGIPFYQQAEDLLYEFMPAFPALYGVNNTVYSERISNVVIDAFSFLDVRNVEVIAD